MQIVVTYIHAVLFVVHFVHVVDHQISLSNRHCISIELGHLCFQFLCHGKKGLLQDNQIRALGVAAYQS